MKNILNVDGRGSHARMSMTFVTRLSHCLSDQPTLPYHEMTNVFARCGARTHDPEIKSLMLYRLS